MQYRNGDDTKIKILEASEKLFLQKGYSKTTYIDIGKEAYINPSLIYYHFKKKSELLRLVIERQTEFNDSLAERYIRGTDPPYIHFLLHYYIFWFRIFRSEPYRNFYAPSYSDPSADDEVPYKKFLEECRAFVPDFDDFARRHRMDFIASYGIDRYLILHVIQHWETLDPENDWRRFAEYEIQALARLFGVSEEILNRALTEIREVSSRIDTGELDRIFREQFSENR